MPITLELHHINGNHYDNRLENLIILCPNCHSQTTNFRGKNSDFDRELKKKAESTAEVSLKKLLFNEEKRRDEIEANKVKYGEIPKGLKHKKEKRYCLVCGKEITGKGLKYCSNECAHEALKRGGQTKQELLELSFRCTSILGMARELNVSDSAIRK